MRNRLTITLLLISALGTVTSCTVQTSPENQPVVETPAEISSAETTPNETTLSETIPDTTAPDVTTLAEEPLEQSEQLNTSAESETMPETTAIKKLTVPLKAPWNQFDLDNELYTLEDITAQLEEWGMTSQETFNVSTERVDLVCEDGTRLIFLNKWKNIYDGKFYEGMMLVMIDNSFSTQGFQESYLKGKENQSALEYCPLTGWDIMSESDLMKMSQTDLSIARNEIYARHGRVFTDPFLNAVFSLKTWYQPQYTEEQFGKLEKELLTEVEKENLKTIVKVEETLRYRLRAGETYRIPQVVRRGYKGDLDLDGTPETVLFACHFDGPNYFGIDYYFMVNPKQHNDSIVTVEESCLPYLYSASLDHQTTQLLVTETQDRKPAATAIYYYKDGQLQLAGRINAFNLEIYDDCFYAYRYIDQDLTLTERVRFVYENDTIYEK